MKYIYSIILMFVIWPAYAGSDFLCAGEITEILAEHPGCGEDEEYLAYKTSVTGESWICTTTKSGTSLILAAKLSNKQIKTILDTDSGSSSCSNVINFSPVEYIVF